jgi:hypothetical protein
MGSVVAVSLMAAFLFWMPAAAAAPQGECLPDPGAGKLYFCDPLLGSSSEGEVHGGTFEADGGWSARTRADGIAYSLGGVAVEGRISFFIRGLGDASLPNNDHIIVIADNFPWKDGDPDCRWIEIKIWGVIDTGEGSIFSARGNNCGQTKIVRDHDHAFYDPAAWYHFEVAFDDKEATWSLDGNVLAISTYDCPMSFEHLYIPKPASNKAEDPPIGAVYAYLSFAGTPADPCTGTAHCGDDAQNCGETGRDCGGDCSPCAEPDAGTADAAADTGAQDTGAPDSGPPGDSGPAGDAGVTDDSGATDAGADAGAPADAGTPLDGGAARDTGVAGDSGEPSPSDAGNTGAGAEPFEYDTVGCGCAMLRVDW